MEMTVVVILCIVLVVFGGMTMSQGFISSVDNAATSVEEITALRGEMMRTEISLLSADQIAGNIQVTLSNSGQMKLASFNKWDVIVQYYSDGGTYYTKWLPYTKATLGDNEWQKLGIYLDTDAGTPEAFEPNILNPGEEMKIEAQLNPTPQSETTVEVTISTPNGVDDSTTLVY